MELNATIGIKSMSMLCFNQTIVGNDLMNTISNEITHELTHLNRNSSLIMINNRQIISKMYRYLDLSLFQRNGFVCPLITITCVRNWRFTFAAMLANKPAQNRLISNDWMNAIICQKLNAFGLHAIPIKPLDLNRISHLLNLKAGHKIGAIIISGFIN